MTSQMNERKNKWKKEGKTVTANRRKSHESEKIPKTDESRKETQFIKG